MSGATMPACWPRLVPRSTALWPKPVAVSTALWPKPVAALTALLNVLFVQPVSYTHLTLPTNREV